MDMRVLMAPTSDVVPIGVEHSTLKATLEAAAKDIGVTLSPDPFPEEAVFVRSDQYAFIRAGVPAVYLSGGVVPADEDDARDPKVALRYFLRNCYHRPCDDADSQPIQYGDRSEEHTSELQSLMRTSYAVFCLKKKQHQKTHIVTISQTKIK